MTALFATPAELGIYIDPDGAGEIPLLATVRLRAASRLVAEAVRAATFDVADGMPTSPAVRGALREATLEHASLLVAHDIDPARGVGQVDRQVQSKSLSGGGASVTYGDRDATAASLAAGRDLAPSAREVLRAAGLTSGRLRSPGAQYQRVIGVREYDPTTGNLL